MSEFRTMTVDWNKYDEQKVRDIASRFSSATMSKMVFNLRNLGLEDRGKLIRSVKASIRSTHSEVDRVTFTYEFYGRFFEHGANNVFGRGIVIKPTHWRTEAIETHKPEFDAEISEYYAALILDELEVDSAKMVM